MPRQKDDFRHEMLSDIWKSFIFIAIRLYFFWWSWKKGKSKFLKGSAISLLSISTVTLAFEVGCEIAGKERLAHWITGLLTLAERHKMPARFVFAALILSVAIVLVRHFAEARKPEYEYDFASRLYACIESYNLYPKLQFQERLTQAVGLVYSVFHKAGAIHACFHQLSNNQLVIQPEGVFPPEKYEECAMTLNLNEGVAGKVFSDQKVYYMPRLRWFWAPFLHAVPFEYSEQPRHLNRLPKHTFTERNPAYYLFKPSKSDHLFKALISVPVTSRRDQKHYGVLSVNFAHKDPLGKGDIVMAAVFGSVLADLLSVSPSVPQQPTASTPLTAEMKPDGKSQIALRDRATSA